MTSKYFLSKTVVPHKGYLGAFQAELNGARRFSSATRARVHQCSSVAFSRAHPSAFTGVPQRFRSGRRPGWVSLQIQQDAQKSEISPPQNHNPNRLVALVQLRWKARSADQTPHASVDGRARSLVRRSLKRDEALRNELSPKTRRAKFLCLRRIHHRPLPRAAPWVASTYKPQVASAESGVLRRDQESDS